MYGKGREPGPLAPVLLTGVEGDCERGLREGVEGSTRANAESAATVSSMQATNDNNRDEQAEQARTQAYQPQSTVGKVGFLALVSEYFLYN